jgi:hypothetical protein
MRWPWAQAVAFEIAEKDLSEAGGDAHQLVDGLEQIGVVLRDDAALVRARHLGRVESGGRAQALSKHQRGRDVDAAGLPALIVVLIKPEIETGANLVRAAHHTQVVEDLRSR